MRLECWEGAPRLVGCRVVCAIPTPSRVRGLLENQGCPVVGAKKL